MVDPPPLIRPTPGPVRTRFDYDRVTPFAVGQRRGTTFAARPGSAVAAPCRGRVTFAGRTPRDDAVTVRCGAWAATVLGVTPTVRSGTSVAAGRSIGRAGGAVVGLSLRPVGERWGYVDPRPSLATPRTGTPLGRAPRARRAPRGPRLKRAPRTPIPLAGPVRTARRVPVAADPERPVRVDPRVAGVGLGLAVLGLPALRRRRRSAHRRPGTARTHYLPSVDR